MALHVPGQSLDARIAALGLDAQRLEQDAVQIPTQPPGKAPSIFRWGRRGRWLPVLGRIVSYRWREDNGTLHNSRVFSKTYWSQGDHGVELTVTDNDGYTATNYALIVVCSCCGQEICPCCIE